MRKMKNLLVLVFVIPFVLMTACKEEENVAPLVEILSHEEGDVIMEGALETIKAEADDEDGSITLVTLYIEGVEMASAEASSCEYIWNTEGLDLGEYILSAYTIDDEEESHAVNIAVMLDDPGGLNPDLSYGTLTDIDGNTYGSIAIGEQIWMAENLKVTHYADGSAIPEVSDEVVWDGMSALVDAYCWYDNQAVYGDTAGALYTWAAAMNSAVSSDVIPSGVQGVCPDGWHLPGDAEWKNLEMYLGMSLADADNHDWRGTDEGGQLKEIGFSTWEVPNVGAENSSGFTAVPGGFRNMKGKFYSYGEYAAFWTAREEEGTDKAWYRALTYDDDVVYRQYNYKNQGLSVRCVKD
jgi:uncharacterized protein (TIGR02145 family)